MEAYGDSTNNIVWYEPAGIQAAKNLVDSKSTELKNLKTETYNGKKCVQASVQNQVTVVRKLHPMQEAAESSIGAETGFQIQKSKTPGKIRHSST